MRTASNILKHHSPSYRSEIGGSWEGGPGAWIPMNILLKAPKHHVNLLLLMTSIICIKELAQLICRRYLVQFQSLVLTEATQNQWILLKGQAEFYSLCSCPIQTIGISDI